MNLPTVTISGITSDPAQMPQPGEHRMYVYSEGVDNGTYALLRVADGQTVTAEWGWRCDVEERMPWMGSCYPEFVREHGGSFVDQDGNSHSECRPVLRVRGAADE